MADLNPGPCRLPTKLTGYVPETVPEKLRILRRVAAKVKEEINGTVVSKRPKSIDFTGLPPNLICKLMKWDIKEIEIKVRELDRSIVYHKLMEMYLNERIMPTTYHLFIKLKEIPSLMQLGEFRNYLYKNGFMWKRILEDKCVVIEKPKVVFERYSYLKNIRQYRNEEKTIFFIDELAFGDKGDILTVKQSISRKNEPQVRLIFAVTNKDVQCQRFVTEFSSESFLKWVKEVLLNSLSEPCIIVLNNYKHHCEEILPLPNENSLKRDMCNWLEYFDVPHDPELPKTLLFDLVQRYTDLSKKLYVIDNILEQNGHTVLRLPDCIIKLTPATYYFDMLRINMRELLTEDDVDADMITSVINNVIDSVKKELATEYSDVIVDEEKAMLLKDELLDKIMDELEDSAKTAYPEDGGFDSDLASHCSDSD